MAIAFVQKSAWKVASSFDAAGTVTLDVSAGSLLVAFLHCESNGSAKTAAVSDDRNGAWSEAVTKEYAGYPYVWMYYKENVAAGSTVITPSGAGNYSAYQIAEFSEIATTSPYDSALENTGQQIPGTSLTINGSANNAAADSLILCGATAGYYNAAASFAATGYTGSSDTTTQVKAFWGYKIVSAAASQQAAITWTGSDSAVGYIAAFAGSGGSSTPIPLFMAHYS